MKTVIETYVALVILISAIGAVVVGVSHQCFTSPEQVMKVMQSPQLNQMALTEVQASFKGALK